MIRIECGEHLTIMDLIHTSNEYMYFQCSFCKHKVRVPVRKRKLI